MPGSSRPRDRIPLRGTAVILRRRLSEADAKPRERMAGINALRNAIEAYASSGAAKWTPPVLGVEGWCNRFRQLMANPSGGACIAV